MDENGEMTERTNTWKQMKTKKIVILTFFFHSLHSRSPLAFISFKLKRVHFHTLHHVHTGYGNAPICATRNPYVKPYTHNHIPVPGRTSAKSAKSPTRAN